MVIATALTKAIRKVEKAITGEEPEIDILDTLAEEHEVVAALLHELVDARAVPSAHRPSASSSIEGTPLMKPPYCHVPPSIFPTRFDLGPVACAARLPISAG
jgi:hypothetical protein